MRFLLVLLLFSALAATAQTPEERIKELDLDLPEVRQPVANFVKWRQVGNLLFLSGEGSDEKGTLGQELTVEQGYEAARATGLKILATLKAATDRGSQPH